VSYTQPDITRSIEMDAVLARLQRRAIEVGGMVSVGAGRGLDMSSFVPLWPEASILLVEMDPHFEAGYLELQHRFPQLRYDICGAAREDRIGHRRDSDLYGGAIIPDTGVVDARAIETPFKRLDTLVKEHGIEPPYFLKFDSHGAELEILAGAPEVLAQTSLIMMECYNFPFLFNGAPTMTFDRMSLHMASLGFRVIDMCTPLFRPRDTALWQIHLVFARSDHPSFASNSYRYGGPGES
jgi:FkbM family methyltransferase